MKGPPNPSRFSYALGWCRGGFFPLPSSVFPPFRLPSPVSPLPSPRLPGLNIRTGTGACPYHLTFPVLRLTSPVSRLPAFPPFRFTSSVFRLPAFPPFRFTSSVFRLPSPRLTQTIPDRRDQMPLSHRPISVPTECPAKIPSVGPPKNRRDSGHRRNASRGHRASISCESGVSRRA